MLTAFCHITGGLAFRPNSIDEGLALFEQEAFLNYPARKRPPGFRKAITNEVMEEESWKAVFDVKAESNEITLASSNQALAEPNHIAFMNRNAEIGEPRRRRILRELHAAAAIMEDTSVTDDGRGGKRSLFDPDLKIYPHKAKLDLWRVFIKGVDETPYEKRWWYIFVTFPDSYPVMPPIIRFISVPYHMNVSEEGRVCLNMIEKGYMSTTPVVELLQRIRELFLMPDTDTPLQPAKLDLWNRNRAEYERLARQSAQRFAKSSLDEWLEGLYIENDVDPTFTLTINPDAGVPPYLRSQITGKFIPIAKQYKASSGVIFDIDEFKQLITSQADPICPITGKPLTETLASLRDLI
jgi:ubiquitin-protein ligase